MRRQNVSEVCVPLRGILPRFGNPPSVFQEEVDDFVQRHASHFAVVCPDGSFPLLWKQLHNEYKELFDQQLEAILWFQDSDKESFLTACGRLHAASAGLGEETGMTLGDVIQTLQQELRKGMEQQQQRLTKETLDAIEKGLAPVHELIEKVENKATKGIQATLANAKGLSKGQAKDLEESREPNNFKLKEPPGAAEGAEPAASNIAAAEEAEEGATTLSLEEALGRHDLEASVPGFMGMKILSDWGQPRTDEPGTSSEAVDAELGGRAASFKSEESDTEFKRRGSAKAILASRAWWRKGAAKSPCFCHIRCLHPETSQFLEVWDFFFLFVLAIIAVMIPLEVAFTTYDDELCHPGWRFTLDAILLVDMALQSFIAYPDKKCPSRYIKDPRMIAINYLKTWFVVDLISSFPCHAIERGRLPEIRLVRMLRLHSIFPILSRRQVRIGMSYAVLSLLKFLCGLTFTCHWMACCWAGVAYEVSDEYTWLKAVEAAKGGLKATYHSRSGIYCLSLYWAIMTLTSIGYGDITPQTEKEYLVASLCMLAMATVWAFVIGQMCAVVSTLLPHDVAFKRTMDDLNWLLKDSQMPEPLRMKLRRYFIESRSLCRLHEQKAIIAQMSPMLQGRLAVI
ncbi:Kcnh5, partial [Symbiodinium microadriaticum]